MSLFPVLKPKVSLKFPQANASLLCQLLHTSKPCAQQICHCPHGAVSNVFTQNPAVEFSSLRAQSILRAHRKKKVSIADAHAGGAASQQSDAATPFRFMGSESAPSTPTRSLKKKSGRRSSLLSSSSPRREGSQDLSIFSPSRQATLLQQGCHGVPRGRAIGEGVVLLYGISRHSPLPLLQRI